MSRPSSAPVEYLSVTRSTYEKLGFPVYRWVENTEPPPWKIPAKPLAESRLTLIASGGIYVCGQIAFHFKDDTSFRLIPTDVSIADLRATHFAYDLTDARSDPNVVFPLEPLRILQARGQIGELAAEAIAFMGGIYSSRRVRRELAPAIARVLLARSVELALLVPV